MDLTGVNTYFGKFETLEKIKSTAIGKIGFEAFIERVIVNMK